MPATAAGRVHLSYSIYKTESTSLRGKEKKASKHSQGSLKGHRLANEERDSTRKDLQTSVGASCDFMALKMANPTVLLWSGLISAVTACYVGGLGAVKAVTRAAMFALGSNWGFLQSKKLKHESFHEVPQCESNRGLVLVSRSVSLDPLFRRERLDDESNHSGSICIIALF